MAGEIENYVGGSAPVVSDEAVSLAEAYSNQIEIRNGIPHLPSLPSRSEIEIISRAASNIFEAIKPAERSHVSMDRASKVLAAFLNGYESIRRQAMAEPNAAQKLIATYLVKIKTFPIFIIDAACNEITQGSGLAKSKDCKPGFVPNVAQVFQVCDALMAPYQLERSKMLKVLSVHHELPPPLNKVRSDELKQKLDGLVASMKAPIEAEKARRIAKADERAEDERRHWIMREYANVGLEPYWDAGGNLVSLALLKKMGAELVTDRGVVALRLPNGDLHGKQVRTS